MNTSIKRRGFLSFIGLLLSGRIFAAEQSAERAAPFVVKVSEDRHRKKRIIARISQLFVKVSSRDSAGGLFIVEHEHTQVGGPPKHLHFDQDEWFYVLEGQYVFEVGDERVELSVGDSIFGPRQIAHAFAFKGPGKGRLLIAFQPAGRMEEHFEALAGQSGFTADPSNLPKYGMRRVGPPIKI